MFLVMGITGKVGGATAEHLLAQGKKIRALVRNREKAANWAGQGVDLVDGDWNDSAAIEKALKGVEGAFVMLPAVWAPSPDYKEAKGVIANYVEALTKAAPPRVVALSSMGANRTSGLGMITALSLLEQGFRDLISPIVFVRAGGFFENFLYGLQVAQGGTLPVYYNPTNRKSTMVATNDIGAEVATLLTGPAWSGQRVVELGSMVTADEVAEQLGEVLNLDVKAVAVPRTGWAEAFVLAEYGKTPSTKTRISVLRAIRSLTPSNTESPDGANEAIVSLMVAVAKTLPTRQFQRLRDQLEDIWA
jgi:uncharacterized protein YbjT (DUF2867 family)